MQILNKTLSLWFHLAPIFELGHFATKKLISNMILYIIFISFHGWIKTVKNLKTA